jgi:hypothetical protein
MKTQSSKKRKLFHPDEIATAINRHLKRDLRSAIQMYGGANSLQKFYSKVQQDACLKKYAPVSGDNERLRSEAFTAFLATNARMHEVNRNFRVPRDIPAEHLTTAEISLRRAKALIGWTLRGITWSEIAKHTTHSGGVTRGVSYSDTSQ